MTKSYHIHVEGDIAKEQYQGTGTAITMAGYAYASHLAAVLSGMVGAGILAYFAHGHVNRFVDVMRSYHTGESSIKNWFLKSVFGLKPGSHELNSSLSNVSGAAKEKLAELIAHEERGFFENKAVGTLSVISKNKRAGDFIETLKPEKLAAGFMGAGFGAAFGYGVSSVWAVLKGHKQGNAGKRQFEHAQSEIKHLREKNDDLEKINDRLHEDVVKAETRWKDMAEGKGVGEHHPHGANHAQHKEHKKDKEAEFDAADKPGTHALHAHEHHGRVLHEHKKEIA